MRRSRAANEPQADAIAGASKEELEVLSRNFEKSKHPEIRDRIEVEQAIRKDAQRNPEDTRDRPHP